MKTKRRIEVFSAGCPVCDAAVALVKKTACPSCEITVLDMHDPVVAQQAHALGVGSVPAIAVNGILIECCQSAGPTAEALRAAGVGQTGE